MREGDKDTLLSNIRMVSGERERVEKAVEGMKVLSHTTILGQTKVMVEGEVEEEGVKVENVDLQRYFVEMTKDGE